MKAIIEEYAGHTLRYTRRRYGTQNYTWVAVRVAGEWEDLGDPWPCVIPKKSEILDAIRLLREELT